MPELLGYTATHAGVTNLPRGMASFLFMPLVGYLTGKVDARKLLAAGFLATAFAMYWISNFSLGVASSNFWLPLTVQGAGLGLIFVPLTTVTNDPIPRERMGNATSIFNLMRNIGASVGIAMVETMQVRKSQLHINILGEHVNPANPTGASNRGWDARPFHVTRQGRSNRDPAGLWRGVGNGAAAGGYARL
jgi:DHA2 family multidrug resistance protein